MPFRFIFIILFLTINFRSHGQCPVADFTVKPTICIDEVFDITNTSTGAITYEWDFCEGDLSLVPTASTVINLTGAIFARGIEVIEDNGQWYGFITSRENHTLFRVNFGTSLTNPSPTFNNLGNIGGLLNKPEPIHLINEGGIWYALTHNGGNATLCLITIGSDITNLPTAEIILTGVAAADSGMELAIDDGDVIVILTQSGGTGQHLRINFGNSITNDVTALDLINDGFLTGTPASGAIRDFQLVKQCDKWFGFGISYSTKNFYVLQYGTNLYSKPTLSVINNNTIFGVDLPYRVEVGNDDGSFFAFVSTQGGNFYRLNLGNDLATVNPALAATNVGSIGALNFSLDLVKNGTEWYAFSMNSNTRDMYRIEFPSTCNANVSTSTEDNPTGLSYSTSGAKKVGLKAVDAEGDITYTSNVVTVSTNSAPDIHYTVSTVCQSSPIQFNSVSTIMGLSYFWDFGDTNTSGLEDPSHTYATAGDYQVTLTVQDGTCSNLTQQTIKIYDEPVPDFNIPSGNICTNQAYSFINTTPDNFDGFLTYEWQLDGMSIATTRDLSVTFSSGSDKELKLITTIPGCSVEIAKNLLNVKEGTLPQFSFDDKCVGVQVQFLNNSIGVITDFDWDFGNGFNSTLENPTIEFANDGTYDVVLTLTNADGCVTFDTKPITIHALPTVDFSSELACENLSTQLTDLSSVTLDNLASWNWQFDDGTANSGDQNPQHVFDSFGNYNVKLTTTTTFGCVDSLEQVINVLEGPKADFSIDKTCIDVAIQFLDQSVPVAGQEITEWAWNLGGTFSSQQNPSHTFNNALDYNVSLTVTSENLCISTQNMSLTIPPAPTLDFDIENDCANETATLIDNTIIVGDVVSQWLWELDDQNIGDMSTISHQFPAVGNYDISLTIETENGCQYTDSRIIEINPVPVASFNASFSFGAPPFAVHFDNNSSGANQYYWTFEPSAVSIESDPTYIFNNLGEFDVKLVASNSFNCSDTTYQRIEVLDPILDLELLNFSVVSSANADVLSATIKNNGTIRVDSLEVIIDLGGELQVNEVIHQALNPEETMTVQLGLQFSNRRLEYICATVSSFLEIDDAQPQNNGKCITFNEDQTIITPPYPNPVKDDFTLEIISLQQVECTIEILGSSGMLVNRSKASLVEGNNKLRISSANLKEGIYLIKISVLHQVKVFRISIID